MPPMMTEETTPVASSSTPSKKRAGRPKKGKGRRKILSKRQPDKKVGKMGTPAPKPKKHAAAKVARSRVKKALSPDSLPGEKKLSEKEMRTAISALLATYYPNVLKKDWGKIAIDIGITLQKYFRIIERVIKEIASGQDAEAWRWSETPDQTRHGQGQLTLRRTASWLCRTLHCLKNQRVGCVPWK